MPIARLRTALWDRPAGLRAASEWIAAVTASYLAIGVLAFVAWWATGNQTWVIEFFGGPAAVLMVILALTELWLAVVVTRHFAPDDVLRSGWALISGSAVCQLIGVICSQILGVYSRENPLTRLSGEAAWLIPLMRHIGLAIGGTFRFGLLAAGLHFALKAYQQSGFPGRLARIDWAVLLGFAAYLVRNVVDVVVAMRGSKTPDIWEVLGWPEDPLLLFLLFQALLLFRAASQMGGGRIGLCWKAFSMGVFLTALGDVGLWATNSRYLTLPWSALTWYIWLPAAACFARAPAFQLELIRDAIADARASGSPNPS